MKKKLFLLLILLLLIPAFSRVYAQSADWVSGQINTVPTTVTFAGTVYWEFGFSVSEASGTEEGNLTCLAAYASILSSLNSINLGSSQNVTGEIVSSGLTLPEGDFLVSSFQTTSNSTTLDLVGILKYVWTVLGSFGNVIVSYMQYFLQNSFGLAVPTIVLNSVLILAIGLAWWKIRSVPWPLALILFVVLVGLASNLVTTMQLMTH